MRFNFKLRFHFKLRFEVQVERFAVQVEVKELRPVEVEVEVQVEVERGFLTGLQIATQVLGGLAQRPADVLYFALVFLVLGFVGQSFQCPALRDQGFVTFFQVPLFYHYTRQTRSGVKGVLEGR